MAQLNDFARFILRSDDGRFTALSNTSFPKKAQQLHLAAKREYFM